MVVVLAGQAVRKPNCTCLSSNAAVCSREAWVNNDLLSTPNVTAWSFLVLCRLPCLLSSCSLKPFVVRLQSWAGAWAISCSASHQRRPLKPAIQPADPAQQPTRPNHSRPATAPVPGCALSRALQWGPASSPGAHDPGIQTDLPHAPAAR